MAILHDICRYELVLLLVDIAESDADSSFIRSLAHVPPSFDSPLAFVRQLDHRYVVDPCRPTKLRSEWAHLNLEGSAVLVNDLDYCEEFTPVLPGSYFGEYCTVVRAAVAGWWKYL